MLAAVTIADIPDVRLDFVQCLPIYCLLPTGLWPAGIFDSLPAESVRQTSARVLFSLAVNLVARVEVLGLLRPRMFEVDGQGRSRDHRRRS